MALMWVRLPPLLLTGCYVASQFLSQGVFMRSIIVLSDGETWNTLVGCSIFVIEDTDFHDLCEDRVSLNSIVPVAEIELKDRTP